MINETYTFYQNLLIVNNLSSRVW